MEASLAKLFWASCLSSHKIPLPEEYIPTPVPDTLGHWKSSFGSLLCELQHLRNYTRHAKWQE